MTNLVMNVQPKTVGAMNAYLTLQKRVASSFPYPSYDNVVVNITAMSYDPQRKEYEFRGRMRWDENMGPSENFDETHGSWEYWAYNFDSAYVAVVTAKEARAYAKVRFSGLVL